MKRVLLICMAATTWTILRPAGGMDVGLRLAMWDDGVEMSNGQTAIESPELGSSVPVAWLGKYPELLFVANGDASTALRLMTGKLDSSGRALHVWHDYLTGTDPLDVDDTLKAFIEVHDDMPNVTWAPNLNTNGVLRRVYTIWGKTNLVDGAWVTPTNSAHRFFKVTVEMP